MFYITRKEISKNIFGVLTLAILIIPSLGFAQDSASVTPVALRAMQSRQFNKPANEVIKAINNDCVDNNGTGSVMPIRQIGSNVMGGQGTCAMQLKMPQTSALSFIPILGAVKAMQDSDDMMKSVSRITYDVQEGADGKSSIVRMRGYSVKNDQVTNPQFYAEKFKNLGDAIFTEGLAINPATQQ